MAGLIFDRLGKAYGSAQQPVESVRDVSLEIADGEFCVFVGPSGCGKSTLLRMVAGLENITRGELRIGGQRVNELAPSERDVAMVFQSYALYPHLDVADNLGFAMRIAGTPAAERQQRVAEVARLLQIDHLLARKPRELSGGQRQRVAIGRAMVRQPGVFLFDEPLSNLDAGLREQTRREIARLHRAQGRAASIYVTHDQVEAMTLADRMVLLQPLAAADARRGSVAQQGAPMDLYLRPRNRFVAGFLGSPRMNFVPARVRQRDALGVQVQLPNDQTLHLPHNPQHLADGEAVTLGLRPEHLCPVPPDGLPGHLQPLAARVQWRELLGDQVLLYLEGPGTELVLALPGSGDGPGTPQPGEVLHLAAPLARVHLFNADDEAVPLLAPHTGAAA
ncbi:ABC transporter ATP-binding protein [Aquabacterium sp. OR-4]|uniref:ABC transporter ATP-binding protein n=1 Tax=Aquabacterium sp. OR-4 TaxID=2978127 RepID=UPI0021B1E2D1|nr:ATP-binding cassette domain-containing protein [Aquabacterium sp. OR-4]MDT7838483.1 ATP-binding cassette domain-containing protein [Aquabacterium sp. OR-4]